MHATANPHHRTRSVWLRVLLLLTPLLVAGAARAEDPSEKNEECLECHQYAEDEVITFGDGAEREVMVDAESWAGSVHAGQVACTDCHRQITEYPHPEVKFENERAYELDRGETCQRCHYAYHTRMLDGIHYQMLKEGNEDAPTCVDCHGYHDVKDPSKPRADISKRCGNCHDGIAEEYIESVHGKGITGEQASDYPVCTDCHGAHEIKDPTTAEFHAGSHEICAQCHADAEKMKPYDLNPNVVSTYLEDFHGRSNILYNRGAGEAEQAMATCTDCHGYHDVQSFSKEGTVAEVRERVVTSCRKCHEGATPEFADAWLSHYEPTLEKAPLVWGIKWGYRILIPFIMVGLVLHILMHLWRVRIHR